MGRLGADVEAVEAVGRLFATTGQRLVTSASSLIAAARIVAWQGPDADGFRNEMASTHAPRLRRVGGVLDDLAQVLARQAAQQRAASEGTSSSGGGTPIANGLVRRPEPGDPVPQYHGFHPDDINNDGDVDDWELERIQLHEHLEAVNSAIGLKAGIPLLHLDDGYTPQGQGYDETRDDVLTTYYDDDGVLLSIQDRRTGYESAAVQLGGLDGNNPAKGGGVATDGNHVYVADSKEIFIYTRAEIDAAAAEGRPAVPQRVERTDFDASFLTIHDGQLYVGEFSSNWPVGDYRRGQPELVRYDIDDETGEITEVGRQDIPYFAQGAAVTDEGIYFTTSFSNKPISPRDLVFQEFNSIEDFDLESPSDADAVHDLGFYAEGISIIDGELWVTYEDGAEQFDGDDGWTSIRRIDLDHLDDVSGLDKARRGLGAGSGLNWLKSFL